MKIVSFPDESGLYSIERRQSRHAGIIERILRHCGLWEGPLRTLATARAPPPAAAPSPTESGELELVPDGKFLEFRRRESQENQLGALQLVLDERVSLAERRKRATGGLRPLRPLCAAGPPISCQICRSTAIFA